MNKVKTIIVSTVLVAIISAFTGCNPTPQIPPTNEPTKSIASTVEETETSTLLPTETLTPTPAPTKTNTSTPTPENNLPGTYIIGKCDAMTFFVSRDLFSGVQTFATVKACMNSVIINDDGTMMVNLSWTVKFKPNGNHGWSVGPVKNGYFFTDQNNSIYYDIAAGGCGKIATTIEPGKGCSAWFLYPKPSNEANTFVYHIKFNNFPYGNKIDFEIPDLIFLPENMKAEK